MGKVGVAIDSLEDMAALFDGIPLDRVSTSMTINATAIVLLSLYIGVARRQGVALAELSGTIQNDILKEYVARGTYIYPPRPSLADRHRHRRLLRARAAQLEHDVDQRLPHPRGRIDGRPGSGVHVRARDRVRAGRRWTPASTSTRSASGCRSSSTRTRNFLEEIAKFRAARRLWATIMRDRFHATNPRALQLRFHTQTAGSTLTAQQPDNNIVRVALQALAAVLGGTQSLHCNGRDEALALPTEESARLALRTQQIIAAETGVTNTVDPVAGSFAIETMTNDIERDAIELLARIDRHGGTLTAIETGFIQRQIQESAYAAQLAVDSGESVVVGVNRFTDSQRGGVPLFHVDAEGERRQIERVRAVRAGRSRSAWEAAIDGVSHAAREGGNLVPPIIAAVLAHATVGEIADAMRLAFGVYTEAATA